MIFACIALVLVQAYLQPNYIDIKNAADVKPRSIFAQIEVNIPTIIIRTKIDERFVENTIIWFTFIYFIKQYLAAFHAFLQYQFFLIPILTLIIIIIWNQNKDGKKKINMLHT